MKMLVRDKIPEFIKKEKKIPITHTATEGEYWTMLKAKLKEEVEEFLQTGSDEQLVDIYEVMNAIYEFKKIKKEDLAKLREQKQKLKGSFKARIILERVK